MSLILTRHVSESVLIGDTITVTVLGVKGSQVRLGIAAPRSMSVDREEVRERKLHETLGNGRGRDLDLGAHDESGITSTAEIRAALGLKS